MVDFSVTKSGVKHGLLSDGNRGAPTKGAAERLVDFRNKDAISRANNAQADKYKSDALAAEAEAAQKKKGANILRWASENGLNEKETAAALAGAGFMEQAKTLLKMYQDQQENQRKQEEHRSKQIGGKMANMYSHPDIATAEATANALEHEGDEKGANGLREKIEALKKRGLTDEQVAEEIRRYTAPHIPESLKTADWNQEGSTMHDRNPLSPTGGTTRDVPLTHAEEKAIEQKKRANDIADQARKDKLAKDNKGGISSTEANAMLSSGLRHVRDENGNVTGEVEVIKHGKAWVANEKINKETVERENKRRKILVKQTQKSIDARDAGMIILKHILGDLPEDHPAFKETSGMGATGFWTMIDWMPRTNAKALASAKQSFIAHIAFGALDDMRQSSKSGGALGAIAVKELDLLSDTKGGLDMAQDPADLLPVLKKVVQHFINASNAMLAMQGRYGEIMVQKGLVTSQEQHDALPHHTWYQKVKGGKKYFKGSKAEQKQVDEQRRKHAEAERG